MPLEYQGKGFINSVINKLPFEIHLKDYNFCGPGTKLDTRLKRGDRGINKLDESCREHDISYSKSTELGNRHIADKILQDSAWRIVKDRSGATSLGEKASALLVAGAMKLKRKLGMGATSTDKNVITTGARKTSKKRKRKLNNRKRVKKVNLRSGVVKKVQNAIKKLKIDENDLTRGTNIALATAKMAIKEAGGKSKIQTPRVIPVPKRGGFLPILPILATLSALGALGGGAAGVAKAVNDSREGRKKLEENSRHNRAMEAIALGAKGGSGLYLKQYRKGLGLFITKRCQQNKKNF